MGAEGRHRCAIQKLRAEMAEMERRNADAIAAQEMETAHRLASAETDFAAALREAACAMQQPPVLAPGTAVADVSVAQDGDVVVSSEEDPLLHHSVGSTEQAMAVVDENHELMSTRLNRAIQTIRRRADEQLADAELRHTEALLSERERADRRMAAAERRHEDALRAARDAGERRLAAAEALHVDAIRRLQGLGPSLVQEDTQEPVPILDMAELTPDFRLTTHLQEDVATLASTPSSPTAPMV